MGTKFGDVPSPRSAPEVFVTSFRDPRPEDAPADAFVGEADLLGLDAKSLKERRGPDALFLPHGFWVDGPGADE